MAPPGQPFFSYQDAKTVFYSLLGGPRALPPAADLLLAPMLPTADGTTRGYLQIWRQRVIVRSLSAGKFRPSGAGACVCVCMKEQGWLRYQMGLCPRKRPLCKPAPLFLLWHKLEAGSRGNRDKFEKGRRRICLLIVCIDD